MKFPGYPEKKLNSSIANPSLYVQPEAVYLSDLTLYCEDNYDIALTPFVFALNNWIKLFINESSLEDQYFDIFQEKGTKGTQLLPE